MARVSLRLAANIEKLELAVHELQTSHEATAAMRLRQCKSFERALNGQTAWLLAVVGATALALLLDGLGTGAAAAACKAAAAASLLGSCWLMHRARGACRTNFAGSPPSDRSALQHAVLELRGIRFGVCDEAESSAGHIRKQGAERAGATPTARFETALAFVHGASHRAAVPLH